MVERFQFNSPICDRGPCSAETEEQVLKIAHELKDSDVSVLEQEYGSQEHVQEDLKVLGNRVEMVEKSERRNRLVDGNGSCQRSCKLALEYDIDVLWVGARTTVNPLHARN
jgi:chorismate mutase